MATVLSRVLNKLWLLFSDVAAAINSIVIFPSLLYISPRKRPKSEQEQEQEQEQGQEQEQRHIISLKDLGDDIHHVFLSSLSKERMAAMSERIRSQFRSCLASSPVSMLPSFTHALPSGTEVGTYLALDVGGSTLRVALIRLRGRSEGVQVLRTTSSPIDNYVKSLEGTRFFDWMADSIDSMLPRAGDDDCHYGRGGLPLAVGLSWSFPIEQTSVRSGRAIHMGKGFQCSNGTVGQDLGELIMTSCRKRQLNIQVEAIVNDSSATLLAQAYSDADTRMSLILGTGTNVAIHYPVRGIGAAKFGARPQDWFDRAENVVVNSELSMFGGGILPMTRWDDILNRTHLRPNYQPLEYMITGRYLGEIVRLIIVEAVDRARLFGGELPHSMREPYSLDTSIVAVVEADASPSLSSSASLLQKEHTFARSPSTQDLLFLQRVCRIVSKRSAGYLATAIHSMWCLHNDSTKDTPGVTKSQNHNLSIACDGSVINKYPGFRSRCQGYLDQLTQYTAKTSSDSATDSYIRLEPAPDSAILGAAVAVAVAVAEGSSTA